MVFNRLLTVCGLCLMLMMLGCASDWPQAVPLESSVPGVVTVPMNIADDVPVVEVMINGDGPFRMIIDTGSGAMILPARVAEALKLPRSQKGSTLVRTASGPAAAHYRQVDALRIGEAEFRGVDASIVEGEMFDEHRGFDGVVGLRVFHDVLLTLDYPNRRLHIDPQGTLTANDSSTLAARLRGGQQMTIPVTLAGQPMRVMIDTGAAHGLKLTDARLLQHRVNDLGSAVTPTGRVSFDRGRVAGDLVIGPHRVRRPVATVSADTGVVYSVDPHDQPFEDDIPILGSELLRHFAVAIDQRRQLVQLQRQGSDIIAMPAVRDIWLGVDTRWTRDAIVVTGPGSPPQNQAQRKAREVTDLRPGDRIIGIGGVPLAEITAQRWRDMLADGNAIYLTIERDGKASRRLAPIITLVPGSND